MALTFNNERYIILNVADIFVLIKLNKKILVIIAEGQHLFPFRTQQLSPPAPIVLQGQPCGRVGHCQNMRSPIAQLVERVAVNHFAVGSSPTRGAIFYSFLDTRN